MANDADEPLDFVRPAVAMLLLWAGSVWAQVEQQPIQPVDRIRLDQIDRPAHYSSNISIPEATTGATNFETLAGPAVPDVVQLRLATGFGYDDNVFRTEQDTRSDFFWNVRPAIVFNGWAGKHELQIGYNGDYRTYFDYTTEDFYDHRIFAKANLDLTRKVDFNLGGQVWWGHDPRGAPESRIINPGDLDTWRNGRIKAELVYGRDITRAQIIPWVEFSQMRYLNNNQSDRDYDQQDYRIRGRWRFTPRFYGIVEGGIARIDYTDPNNQLDRDEYNLLAGVGWQATAKTSGEVLVGLLNQNFDDPAFGDTTNLDWNARIYWSPKPYSKVTAFAQRTSQDAPSPQGGNYLADTLGVEWRHAFTDRLELNTALEHTFADYDTPRKDNYWRFNAKITQNITPWLDVTATYQFLTRSSNIPGLDYDDNMVILELELGKDYVF